MCIIRTSKGIQSWNILASPRSSKRKYISSSLMLRQARHEDEDSVLELNICLSYLGTK